MTTTIIQKEDQWYWPDGSAGENSWKLQRLSANLFTKIKPYLKNNDVMVQAGGNCGLVISQFVDHFNHIYTFEPDPTNFICLTLNITSEKVTKLQACVGNSNEMVNVVNYMDDIGAVHVKGRGYVPSFKIDDLKLQACDLIQLDVEGYEYNALLGAVNTIEKFNPVICVEWCDIWATRYNVSRTDWDAFFKNLGYIHVFDNECDQIYIKK